MMERIHLVGLTSKMYEHPFDRSALNAVKKFPLEKLFATYLDWTVVKQEYVIKKGSCFHVTEKSCSQLYSLIEEAAAILDLKDFPKVFLEMAYGINGYTTGYKESTIMSLNSGVIDMLTDMEQTFVIGHEMGHIKSGHVIYHCIVNHFADLLNSTFLPETMTGALLSALQYWYRMSEYTADRAGLLACQDPEAAMKALIKMSGVPIKYADCINIDEYIREAEHFEKGMTQSEDFFKKLITITSLDHPWTLYRVMELKKWVDSGEYENLIKGNGAIKCPVCGKYNIAGATECEYCQSELAQ